MTYFKHKETGKYLSFLNEGTSFNNSKLVLSDCPMCDDPYILEPAKYNDNNSSTYLIKSVNTNNNGNNDECLAYDENDETHSTMILGSCSDAKNTEFEMFHRTQNPLPIMTTVDVLLLFDNNKNVNLSDENVRKMVFTNTDHSYSPDVVAVEHYFSIENPILYDHDGTRRSGNEDVLNYENIYSSNILIKGNMALVIKEILPNSTSPKITKYKMVYKDKNNLNGLQNTDDSIKGGIIFSQDTNLSGKKVVLKYFKQNDQNRNFNRASLGVIISDVFFPGKLDIDIYKYGIAVYDDTDIDYTTFRAVPYENIKNSEMIYKYQSGENTNNVNISSGINENKKIVYKNGVFKSKNKNDGVKDALFHIEPTTMNRNEPLDNSIIGNDLVDLKTMISSNVNNKRLIIEVIEQIDKINNKLEQNSNIKFHHVETIVALKEVRSLFEQSKNVYKSMNKVHNKFKNKIIKLPIHTKILYLSTNTNDVQITYVNDIYQTYNENIGNVNIGQAVKKFLIYNTNLETKQQQNNNKTNEYKSIFNLFQYDKITPNTEAIVELAQIIQYYSRNKDLIGKHMNAFYDYLGDANNNNPFYDDNFMKHVTTEVSDVEIENLDNVINKLNTFDSEERKDKDKMMFVDIDFGIIYSHMRDLLSISLFVLKSQRNYIDKHNAYIKLKSYFDNLNLDGNSLPENPKSVIEYYAEMIKNVTEGFSYLLNSNNNSKLSSFFIGINDCNEKIKNSDQSENSIDAYFVNRYKLILGLDCTQQTNDCTSYTEHIKNINSLDEYYSLNTLLMKYEQNIISAFINNYGPMANEAAARLGQSDVFSAKSNNSGLEPFVEGYTDSSDYYPSVPTPLNKPGNTELLNYSYSYASGNSNYDTLNDYLNSEYEEVNTDEYTCGDNNININMSYKLLNSEIAYSDDITNFDVTQSDQCDFHRVAVLKYDETTKYVVLELSEKDSNDNLTLIETIEIHGEIEHYSDCVTFTELNGDDENDYMVMLETISNSQETSSSSMKYVQSISDIEISSLTGYDALYSEDLKIRLVLSSSSGAHIQYIPPISLSVTSNDDYEHSATHDNIVIYENSINLGKHFGNSIYIDSLGKSHSVGDSYKSSTNVSYQNYDNFCLDGNYDDSNDNNDSTIGKFEKIEDTSKEYPITVNDLKYIYPAGTNGCVDGDYDGTMKLSKFPFHSKFGPCATDPDDVSTMKISDYDGYDAKYTAEFDFKNDSVCGLKQMLNGEVGTIDEFQTIRLDFKKSFEIMINSYNELSKSELELLHQTDINISQLKNIQDEYESLQKTVEKNSKLKTIVDSQKNDAKQVLDNTDYSMAIAGIGAVGGLLFLFNYMKK